MKSISRRTALLSTAVAIGGVALASRTAIAQQIAAKSLMFDASHNPDVEKIDPYRPRFGRSRPLVAVVALNDGTIISDFVIPFGVMARSGVAEVVSVAVKQGVVRMQPLTFRLQSTVEAFDRQYPEGADYLFVPAVDNFNDPELVDWVRQQGSKGCTVISICYGALVVAKTGLFDGHRATSHYSNEAMRASLFPDVIWQKNIRYVADGKVVSSAGVSASMPISIALVEAIAGPQRAAQVAREVGIDDWSSRHDSDAFRADPGNASMPALDARPNYTLGIPVKEGDDEIVLALTAESYSRTGITMAYAVADTKDPVSLAHGLVLLPDLVAGEGKAVDRTLPPLEAHHATKALDIALRDIAQTYSRKAAHNVALFMEYPGNLD